ncbi:MAG: ATP-dependent DNA helicase RecG [Bacteroidales bacterium]
MNEFFFKDIKFLPGVGPSKAEVLEKELSIKTFGDLLYYFPYKYVDRSKVFSVNELRADMAYVQVKVQLRGWNFAGEGRKKRLVAIASDDTGQIELVWFKGLQYVQNNYQLNKPYLIYGKPTLFNGHINIAHPEIEDPAVARKMLRSPLQGHYNSTEKARKKYINSRNIGKLVGTLWDLVHEKIEDTLPDYLVQRFHLMPLAEALKTLHFPHDHPHLEQARYRIKFEELFLVQVNLIQRLELRNQKLNGYVFKHVGNAFTTFYHQQLPFELTGAQKRVLKEIRKDMGSGKQMNRLLQGDVGSGKTLVALMTMLLAVDNGFQACMMAPTEILATQHYESVTDMLKGMDVKVQLLTGSTRSAERKKMHTALLAGDIDILVGTHALIEDVVQFQQLGVAVIDEQHRFGVAQRARLWKKSQQPPHVLVMTATPIPRTLAMTIYGDLDVSVIDEMPPGRKPIRTLHYFESKRLPMFEFLRKEIQKGRQIYIVYPLISESEKMDYKDLEDGYLSICRVFPQPEYAVSIVHGKMKAADKEYSMKLFAEGKTQIMVATTVIEVGVNVPNASVMVVESAERFGLSQLHQLRGRVGRGAEQSYCLLMTSHKLSEDARKRLEMMVHTNDGFEIADADLKLRGPGDIEGTQQSGLGVEFKLANLARDGTILTYARDIAIEVLAADPGLQLEKNRKLNLALKQLKANKMDYSIVS